ncbi:glycosyltransferase [Acidianus sp. RZ1]|uniref:glycosyltransferase n=1 Tax=Acidianus sp. RZ1 TaxID=1540082 RepID=UPI0014926F3D|nr:glycosyltransferase [Acidianus sp. RZ1]NON61267.1 glycosyltransferase [Acidianus sp. RZ1]
MLSIVIPAYNEEKRIGNAINTLEKWLPSSEIIVIFDGKDKTPEVARLFQAKIYESKERLGKGGAIKEGIRRSTGERIFVIDADIPISKDDALRMISTHADLVIPKRKIIGMPWKRRFLHGSFIFLVKLFFPSLANISDFQGGAKVLNGNKAKNVLDEIIINDLLIDINLIYAFKRRKYKVREIEVGYVHDESNSKISRSLIKVIILMFLSLIKLRVYYSPLRGILQSKTFLKVQDLILRRLR